MRKTIEPKMLDIFMAGAYLAFGIFHVGRLVQMQFNALPDKPIHGLVSVACAIVFASLALRYLSKFIVDSVMAEMWDSPR